MTPVEFASWAVFLCGVWLVAGMLTGITLRINDLIQQYLKRRRRLRRRRK